MKIKKIDISSIFPTIIKNIKLSFDDVNKLLKLILSILYIVEFKVLVSVRMDNLNDFSKPILSTTRKLDKIKRLKKNEMNIKKERLNSLTECSRLLDELLNRKPNKNLPYVGASAF